MLQRRSVFEIGFLFKNTRQSCCGKFYLQNKSVLRPRAPADHCFGSTTFVPRASRRLLCELRIMPEAFISQDAISCEIKSAPPPAPKYPECDAHLKVQIFQTPFLTEKAPDV